MIPNIFVGLMLGVGVGAWVYAKAMRQTGNNTKSAITVAAIVGCIACVAIIVALSAFHFGQ